MVKLKDTCKKWEGVLGLFGPLAAILNFAVQSGQLLADWR